MDTNRAEHLSMLSEQTQESVLLSNVIISEFRGNKAFEMLNLMVRSMPGQQVNFFSVPEDALEQDNVSAVRIPTTIDDC